VNFSRSIDGIVSFAQNNPIIVIVLVLGLLFFMYRKPRLFFSLLGLSLFLAGLFYLIMSMAGSGSEQKKKLTHEEDKQFDTNR
jgi:multisubunit Na+/H+ antiporter MnhC subunit